MAGIAVATVDGFVVVGKLQPDPALRNTFALFPVAQEVTVGGILHRIERRLFKCSLHRRRHGLGGIFRTLLLKVVLVEPIELGNAPLLER